MRTPLDPAVLHLNPPPPAPSPTDHTTQEAACADSDAPWSDALVSTADVAAQAGGGDDSPRSTPGPVPRVGRLTEHAARGWRPPSAESEIVCHLCGWAPGQHPSGHRAMWVEAA